MSRADRPFPFAKQADASADELADGLKWLATKLPDHEALLHEAETMLRKQSAIIALVKHAMGKAA